MKRSTSLLALAFACVGCGAQPPAAASLDTPPPSNADLRLRGFVTVAAVPMSAASLGDAEARIAWAIRAQTKDLVACMRTDATTIPDDLWIVGRVDATRRPASARVVSKGVAEGVATCAIAMIEHTSFGDARDFAFAVVVRAERAPADCVGPACIEIPVADPEAPPPLVPPTWIAERANGDDNETVAVLGGLTGTEVGDAFGAGGLDLTGVGEGGPGEGSGAIGTFDHGAGTGMGQGMGKGSGRLDRPRRSKPPSVRMGGFTVSGGLPEEVVRRIVRSRFGSYRLCYENALRTDATLAGAITTTLTIRPDGTVSGVSSVGLDAFDRCIASAVARLSFPEPDPTYTVDGKEISQLTLDAAVAKLDASGWRTAAVLGPPGDASFVVFAMKGTPALLRGPHGFLTSVRRVAPSSAPSTSPGESGPLLQKSDGAALVYEGLQPRDLAGALTHTAADVDVKFLMAFNPES